MTRVSTYGSVSSGIRQGLKHERAREATRRRGQVYEIRPGHEAGRARSGIVREKQTETRERHARGVVRDDLVEAADRNTLARPILTSATAAPRLHVQPTTILDGGQAISGGPGSAM